MFTMSFWCLFLVVHYPFAIAFLILVTFRFCSAINCCCGRSFFMLISNSIASHFYLSPARNHFDSKFIYLFTQIWIGHGKYSSKSNMWAIKNILLNKLIDLYSVSLGIHIFGTWWIKKIAHKRPLEYNVAMEKF